MREFSHIKLEHLEGKGWWFWTRESFAVLNWLVAEEFRSFVQDPDPLWDIRTWLSALILIPVAYCVVPTFGGHIRKLDTIKRIINGEEFEIFNKKNIAYFTVLEMLSGGGDNND